MTSRLSFLSPYWLWLLLALPALGIANEALTSTDPKALERALHPSGEFAARFMIISMLASPLMLVFKGWRGPRWLRKNRRYFGVAAFGYALLHLSFYLIDKASLARILGEVTKLDIWTGWVAFAIFLPLAATSMDYAVRKLGTSWKPVQRLVYGAALLIFVHWAAQDEWKNIGPALVHFAPLAALEAYRFWYWYLRPRPVAQ